MIRLLDYIAEAVREAIDGLDVLKAVKDGLQWEAVPILTKIQTVEGPGLGVGWFLGVGVRVPATGDWEFPFLPLGDAHDKEEIRTSVMRLYATAQASADAEQLRAASAGNGHRKSAGGLDLP